MLVECFEVGWFQFGLVGECGGGLLCCILYFGEYDQKDDDDLVLEYFGCGYGCFLFLDVEVVFVVECLVDVVVGVDDVGYLMVELLFEGVCLGYELEVEVVVDYGEVVGCECKMLVYDVGDFFVGCGGVVGKVGFVCDFCVNCVQFVFV